MMGMLNHQKALAALFLLGLAGCVDLGAAPPPAAPPAPPSAAFDGNYSGPVKVIGASTSMNPQDCATTDPRLRFTVRDGRFGFALVNKVAGATPTLHDLQTSTYAAQIIEDGTVTGRSEATGAVMKGQVTGTRMSAEVYGLLCTYAFTADRR